MFLRSNNCEILVNRANCILTKFHENEMPKYSAEFWCKTIRTISEHKSGTTVPIEEIILLHQYKKYSVIRVPIKDN